MKKSSTRIVILGGGFAGATVARDLEKLVDRPSDLEITIADQENYSLFTPLFAGGTLWGVGTEAHCLAFARFSASRQCATG